MAKRFIKVHTKLLMEAFCHKSGFVTIDGAITIAFQFINPLSSHNIMIGMRRNKHPSTLSLKSRKLFIHCFAPLRMLHCNFEAWRLQFRIVNLTSKSLNSSEGLRFRNTIFRSSDHRMSVGWN